MGALCNLIESRFHLGGMMMASFHNKDVYNFPGIPSIKGSSLINNLISKATSNGMKSQLGEYMYKVSGGGKGIVAVTTNRNQYMSSTVIITSGLKAFYSPFTDYIKIKDWDGTGVFDNWPAALVVKGKTVGIFYGGSQEIKVPPFIHEAAAEIMLVVDDNWATMHISRARAGLGSESLSWRKPWTIVEIRGNGIPESLVLVNEESGERIERKLDIAIGFYDGQARQTVFSNTGIEMIGQQIRVDQRMQTSMKRVYAAGDIAWYPGKVKVLSAGIYEAGVAIKNALKVI